MARLHGPEQAGTVSLERFASRNAMCLHLLFLLCVHLAAGALSVQAMAAEPERTFIAIKPDGVQRGLVS